MPGTGRDMLNSAVSRCCGTPRLQEAMLRESVQRNGPEPAVRRRQARESLTWLSSPTALLGWIVRPVRRDQTAAPADIRAIQTLHFRRPAGKPTYGALTSDRQAPLPADAGEGRLTHEDWARFLKRCRTGSVLRRAGSRVTASRNRKNIRLTPLTCRITYSARLHYIPHCAQRLS